MNYYKDFTYIEYVLSLPFESGLKLYLRALERTEEESLYKLWLVEVANGCELNFNDYFKNQKNKAEEKNMNIYDKEDEEKRIIDKIENRKIGKMKKVNLLN
jgi:hypothetical protein